MKAMMDDEVKKFRASGYAAPFTPGRKTENYNKK